MWTNWEVASFIDLLKSYNENLSTNKRIGFNGLDVYSFKESIHP
ncbi:erythromycin esterase family protein [Flavobacterium sp. DSR3-2]